jgi:hypothetical protein
MFLARRLVMGTPNFPAINIKTHGLIVAEFGIGSHGLDVLSVHDVFLVSIGV